jgi:hypothetical protein
MDVTIYKVTLELTEDILGTVPKNREVYAAHIATKDRELIEKKAKMGIPLCDGTEPTSLAISSRISEEVETIEEIEEKGWTGFHTTSEGDAFLFDYALKGFLCESARTHKEIGNVKQLQDKFKRYVFVFPRRIILGKVTGTNERPLRALTAQGPRVALARSDTIGAGTKLSFEIHILEGGGITQKILKEVLT